MGKDEATEVSERPVDRWNLAVHRLFGVSEEWRWFRLEMLNGVTRQVLVEGCVPDGVYASGPKKGRPRWDRKKAERFVVDES